MERLTSVLGVFVDDGDRVPPLPGRRAAAP